MTKVAKTEMAEDLVQETFLAGLKSRNSFKGNSSESTWLYSINKSIMSESENDFVAERKEIKFT